MRRVISAAFHLLVLVALFNALILLIRNLRYLRRLEDEHPPDADDLPSINVLIPARNERDVLPRCLDSLQNQLYSRFSVTVLDDGSNDGTGDFVKGYSSQDSRFRLIEGSTLPDGWTGKPWACQQLADSSDGDILLFVDADTWFEPDVLRRTAGLMQREQPGLFSVLPRQVAGTFAERLVLPGLYMIFLCGVPLWRLEASTHPDVAAANGQFICMWAQEYRRIAGHRGVQDLVVEDIALARNIKRGGGSVIARTAISSVHCRMYRSNRAVFDGFSKNAYASFDERPERVLISILVMLATHIVPIWLLVRGVLNRKNLGALHLVLPALEVGLGMLLRLIVSQRMGFRHLDAVLAQLNALAYVVITARSMWWRYVGGGYQWKGRRYLHAGSVR